MSTKSTGGGRVKLNTEGLDQLEKAFRDQMNRPMKVRVGIMGDHADRTGGGPTNPEIGAAHEYGAPAKGLPARSFLRVPLMDNLNREMNKAGLFTKTAQAEVVKKGSIRTWLELVAVQAEAIVKGAFASDGYGKWAAWKKGYQSKTGQILVDTTQLRDSITSEVVE